MPVKKTFNIFSNDTWSSLAQVEIFKEKVVQHFPDVLLNLIFSMESGEPDFLIDNSISHDDRFSVALERGLLNDVAIFNPSVLSKIDSGKSIIIGSSIPGQTLMAIRFLEKALPNFSKQPIDFDFQFIDGNMLERLNQLDLGKIDAIILSAADVNLLLSFELSRHVIQQLLQHKKTMLLPLFDCPPKVGQGAIIASTTNNNDDAIEILRRIGNENLTHVLIKEIDFAENQQVDDAMAFGVFHITTTKTDFNYAAGIDKNGKEFTAWDYRMELDTTNKKVFSSAAYMKDFFTYEYFDEIELSEDCKAVFIASHKAIHSLKIKKTLEGKRVWAAGTKSWFQLAKQGIWVEGCADGIGLEWLKPIFESKLVDLNKEKITIITNKASADEWKSEGWKAVFSYKLILQFSQTIADAVASSDILFWTSFQQYEMYKNYCNSMAQHACPAGKTADLLIRAGLSPFIFPTIKAFNDWMLTTTIKQQ